MLLGMVLGVPVFGVGFGVGLWGGAGFGVSLWGWVGFGMRL